MVIYNEKEYIKNIIEQHDKERRIHIDLLIQYIVKYYYSEYKDKSISEYVQKVQDVISTFNYDDWYYRPFMKNKYIRNLCKKAQKGEFNTTLREIDSVIITEAEMKIIAKGENDRQRKVLFTLYVLAKVYGYHSGWVNYPTSEIFKLANVSLKMEDRYFLLHDLYNSKLIDINHDIRQEGYKVELHEDSPTSVTVSRTDKLGNFYLSKVRDGWTMCERCGRLIKKQGKWHKYCKKCAEEINREKTRINMQEHRENSV